MMMLTSCTLNLSNIDTHGIAEDLVDENFKTDADANFDIPVG